MSRLTEGWLDEFGFRHVPNPRSGGSTYDPEGEGYPWRFVWHSIESRSIPNTAAHASPPHVWVSYETGQLIQTIPLTRGACALYQSPFAPYYTNRARALQIEVAGFAAEAPYWSDAKLDWLAEKVAVPICRFVEAVGGRIDLSDAATPLSGPIPGSAREDAPQRVPPIVWAFGVGNTWHRHVPMGDDHWDWPTDTRRFSGKCRAAVGGPGHPQPIPTPARRRRSPVQATVRRHSDGTVVHVPAGNPLAHGFNNGVVILDFPGMVFDGYRVGVAAAPNRSMGPTNARVVANGAEVAAGFTGAFNASAGWASPAFKTALAASVLVDATDQVYPLDQRGEPGAPVYVTATAG